MATLSAIAVTHDGALPRPIGLRRAVVGRHALLGDRTTLRDNVRALLSHRAWQRPACVVPVGRASASDLALGVSRRLLERLPGLDRERVGAVIYCHEAPDEQVSESTAGRLQYELGLRSANPFAISQAHRAGLWIALDLALGLVDGPEDAEHVLLVASDKLVFADPGANARRLLRADVAAAGLVSRHAIDGWRVEQVQVRQFATPHDALSRWPRRSVAEFAAFGGHLLRQALHGLGLKPARLHEVLGSAPGGAFACAVHRAAGLAATAGHPPRRHGSSADLLLALAEVQRSVPAGAPVLAWSAGHNGEFACCVLTRC